MSQATRHNVVNAARLLGYHHPGVAAAASQEHLQIQLLIPQNDALDNTYWIDVMSGAEAEAHRLNCDLITVILEEGHSPRLNQKKRDGVLLAGRRSRRVFAPYLEPDAPSILIGYPNPGEAIDAVMVSSWEAGVAIGQHLRDLGHSRIVFLTDAPGELGRSEKLRGIKNSFRGESAIIHEVAFDPEKEHDDLCQRVFEHDATTTAIVAACETLTIAAILALSTAGYRVPDDISLVGSDVSPRSNPGRTITSSIAPMHQLGAAALAMLVGAIRTPTPHAPRRIAMLPKLVVRQSTGPVNTSS